PGGIGRPAEGLEPGKVAINGAMFRTAALSSKTAEIAARVWLDSDHAGPARMQVAFVPHNFRGRPEIREEEIVLNTGETVLERSYELEGPRLWWTHDLGRPHLYRIIVEVQMKDGDVSDRLETMFGIRRFEMEDWIPVLNGRRMFLKGSNYGPGDTRMAMMSRSRYRRDLKLAVKAHMNFLRVHAHVEAPEFYQAADEAGVLLWQDFPLQWLYSKDVLEPALDQMEEMVRLLNNHPSVAIWCMHNEPFGVPDTAKLGSGGLRGRWRFFRMLWTLYGYSWNREVLDSRLAARAQELDSTRPVVRSSGEWALPWRRGTDGHHYHGWYPEAGPLARLDRFLKWFPRNFRFVTEFGAQSFPNLKSSRKFMAATLEELDWDRLEERHHLQRRHLRRWVAVDDMPTLEALVGATQEYQAEVNQYFVDRLRRRKYQPTGGIANFMFHDPNPAVSWSVLDHWRVPKRSYDRLAQAYHPEYVFALMDRAHHRVGEEIEIPIYVINDSPRDRGSVRVSVQVFNSEGQVRLEAGFASELPADSTAIEVGRVRTRFQEAGTRRLVLRLFYGARVFENSYRLRVEGGS
ncbi:MAG: glycoside hydrolase family 2 TIM barrel-domain containing protein, partial [Anaerolineae bacterium]